MARSTRFLFCLFVYSALGVAWAATMPSTFNVVMSKTSPHTFSTRAIRFAGSLGAGDTHSKVRTQGWLGRSRSGRPFEGVFDVSRTTGFQQSHVASLVHSGSSVPRRIQLTGPDIAPRVTETPAGVAAPEVATTATVLATATTIVRR